MEKDSDVPQLPEELEELCAMYKASQGQICGPEVDLILLIGYIDGDLPTEEMRRDIQLLVENEPRWNRAYEEFKDVAQEHQDTVED